MKKYLFLLLAAILTLGCGRPVEEKKEILAKINNYEITWEEFEGEFKASSYGYTDTAESRKEFLNTLINRKLILQDAQKKGLDKDKSFLKMIERFWEQSLLKVALDKKTKEVAGSVMVNDKEIAEAYDNLLKSGKTDKSYDQMYQQIKWEITRQKETQAMNEWVAQLRKKGEIKINLD
ncbi:MAG: hypothetical protein COX40_03295 [Candidatus Omnitrophica bacterium CG23_combo_of_CG06-09_8_20_14_all_40_11]|nr:MAG: hypothetical protein COX40_03295 [Candidatus Omnitrophica bacterium CG23_combo_of_CG06-09_8_20_14_all_40_11]